MQCPYWLAFLGNMLSNSNFVENRKFAVHVILTTACGLLKYEMNTIMLRSSGCSGNLKYLRSEEHTSELQSPDHLVCRLLLEKKKKRK